MLNIFESHLAVRRSFESLSPPKAERRRRPIAALFRWLGARRKSTTLDDFNPALLADVGLKRVGDIVLSTETPDCANNNCSEIFTEQRAA